MLAGSGEGARRLRLAVLADPQLAVAHAALAVAASTSADARTAMERAVATAPVATRRERQHVEIVGLMLSGAVDRGRALAAEHLAEFPTDELISYLCITGRSA